MADVMAFPHWRSSSIKTYFLKIFGQNIQINNLYNPGFTRIKLPKHINFKIASQIYPNSDNDWVRILQPWFVCYKHKGNFKTENYSSWDIFLLKNLTFKFDDSQFWVNLLWITCCSAFFFPRCPDKTEDRLNKIY